MSSCASAFSDYDVGNPVEGERDSAVKPNTIWAASAFLAAGASSATMSLWKVSDKSTAIFMHEFYRNLLNGMSKGEALAAARSILFSQGYKNPFFWGSFVLTGE